MKTTGKWLMVLAFTALAGGPAWAEADKAQATPARTAAWERVGDANAAASNNEAAKAQAPGEDGLRARKADMVRRMFWIMIAHR